MTRLIALAIALSFVACAQAGDPWYVSAGDATGGGDTSSSDAAVPLPAVDAAILQIFEANTCLTCHDGSGGGSVSGGFDISSLEGLLAGGNKAGAAIVPCDPDASPLLEIITGGIDDGTIKVAAMPLGGAEPVGADGVEAIRAWITEGAGVEDCAAGPLPEIDAEILTLFEDNKCMDCHDGSGGGGVSGDLDMSTLEGLLEGGSKAGPSIVVCDADASPLVQVVEGGIDDGAISVLAMPLSADALDDAALAALRAWIDAGAGIESCGGEPEPEPPAWSDDVRPVLESYCTGCHDSYANPLFLSDEATLDSEVSNSYGSCDGLMGSSCILVMMEEGHMPEGGGCAADPDKAGCPTADEIQLVRDWVEAGATH